MAPPACQLRDGEFVSQWRVVGKLGEGGFGAVYKVVSGNGEYYAIKVEAITEKNVGPLMMEIQVLEQLQSKQCTNFCEIKDRGRIPNRFLFVVMTLVGQSLHDIRKSYEAQRFSLSTALRSGMQCLTAIRGLHSVGYLHRDIKPGNYSIGRFEINDQKMVYMLDFGMARKCGCMKSVFLSKPATDGNVHIHIGINPGLNQRENPVENLIPRYINANGQIRRPRVGAAFRGTVRYAPLACHQNEEFSRKDDVESWFYQQIECTTSAVPWRTISDMRTVGQRKQNLRTNSSDREQMLRDCPPEYGEIFNYIISLTYYCEPDYNYILRMLYQAAKNYGYRLSDPYDWELGPNGPPVNEPPLPLPPSGPARSRTPYLAGARSNRVVQPPAGNRMLRSSNFSP